MGRWDWLYEQKARPVRDYILDEFALTAARDLDAWPPELERWESADAERRWRPVLEGARPSDGAVRLALMLARMDFEHREEEMDGFMRSGAWQAFAKTPFEYEQAMFLHVYLRDRALDLKEVAEGAHLKYADLADLMGRIEKQLFKVTLV